MATDFIPRSSTLGNNWSKRMAPSRRLYCVCRCRWVNSGMSLLRASLAPRAWPIQRKSIHDFSTGKALLAALVACVGACAGGEPGSTPTGDRVFVADPPMIRVNPGETGTAKFVLTSGGVPIAAQAVTFEIPDEDELPGVEAKGAVLAATTGVTDGDGVATVDVTAGE